MTQPLYFYLKIVTLGTHGLNEEELGRHMGRNGMTRCISCGDEWKCLAYKNSRVDFMAKIRAIVQEAFCSSDFQPRLEMKSMILRII